MSSISDISTQLTARGFAGGEIVSDVVAAISDAGYELQPIGGGAAVATVDVLGTERYRIRNTRGQYLVKVTLPDSSVVWMREQSTADGRLLTAPSLAAQLNARGFSGDEILADVTGAITDAGYELFPIGGGFPLLTDGEVDTERFRIGGTRGQHALKVTLPDSSVAWLLEQATAKGSVVMTAFKGGLVSAFGM